MKLHFYNIQALRGIAVLLVIFYHLTGVQIQSSPAHPLPKLSQFGAVGVDIFFLISGFLMMAITRHQATGLITTKQFLIKRLIRIYPIYWIISIPITYLVFFSNRELLNNLKLNPDAIRYIPDLTTYLVKSFLLLPQVNLPPLTISWTLIHEVFFYGMFSLLLLLPRQVHTYFLLIWSACTVVFWLALKPTQYQPISYLLCNPLTLEFTTGCAIAIFLQEKLLLPKPQWLVASGAVAIAISWLIWTSIEDYEFPIADNRVLYFLLPCTLLLTGLINMEYQGKYLSPLLQKIGDASYSLYLTHIIFLSIGRKIWKLYGMPESLLANIIFWPALFFITLLLGMLCFSFIEKPLLAICRRLTKPATQRANV